MNSKSLNDAEARELVRKRMGEAGRRVAMAAFTRGSTAESVDNNGTASLLHLPDEKVIVTNYHVWNHYVDECANDVDYRIALTGAGLCRPIDISDAELIYENELHDLCVLSYPADRLEAVGKEYVRPPQWPPKRAKDGEVIAIAGYPGMRRSAEAMTHPLTGEIVSTLRHELILLYLAVEAVSDSQLRMTFRSSTPEIHNLSDRPIDEFRWGGMSGSLVYRFDTDENRFVPCGIFRAGGEGLNTVFYATHLDLIQSDGPIQAS